MAVEITLAIQLAVGLVFLRSTAAKGVSPRAFGDGISQYGIPRAVAHLLSIVIIALEGAAAGAFLTGWHLQAIAPVSAGLLLGFVVVTAVTLWRGLDVSCMCFGLDRRELISKRTLLRTLVMLSATLFVCAQTWRGGDWLRPHELRVGQAGLALGSALLLLAIGSWGYGAPTVTKLFMPCKACHERE